MNSQLETRAYWSRKDDLFKKIYQLQKKGFDEGFNSYWEQFGYEIGGPVCFAYVKWLIDAIANSHEKILDIVFVARDGWLLKKIYGQLTDSETMRLHYVYASRKVCDESHSFEGRQKYCDYIKSLKLQNGIIAVVDSITTRFSAQKLIDDCIPNDTLGFYWMVTKSARKLYAKYKCMAFQVSPYHVLRKWNLIEFIMSSPEPSVINIQNNQPIYSTPDAEELYREKIFREMESGILRFVDDVKTIKPNLQISNRLITEWVNEFLKHPSNNDIAAFDTITFSDGKSREKLRPFGIREEVTYQNIKDELWYGKQIFLSKIYSIRGISDK